MAKVIPIGKPVNEGEKRAIAHLRDALPDDYTVIHNFEVKRDQQTFEVDIALITPHAVFIIDVKGTRGTIEVQGSKWYPEGRRPFNSPLPKLREHAKAIKGLLTEKHPTNRDLERVFTAEAVILSAPDAYLVDPRDRDADHVCTLKKAEAFFASKALLPNWASDNIKPFHKLLLKTITGEARARTGPLVFGNWEVIERIGASDLYTEYRACNATTGRRADTVNLRVYQADPYAEADERKKQRNRIQNAYEALSKLSPHPNIAGARDFFVNEHEDQYILVSDDLPGKALQLHITRSSLALTRDQKWQVALEALDALSHAHAHGVVHRNITPASIMLGKDGITRLVDFDFARSGPNRTNTIADEISDTLSPQYAAPECFQDAAAATPASDVYSVGIVLYEMLTGERPFASLTEAFDQSAKFPAAPSSLADGLPVGFDEWLQTLCAFMPADRPSAATAFAQLEALLKGEKPQPEATKETETEKPEPSAIDYAKLPAGFQLAGKYVIQQPLGKPGSFGVVYKVFDSLADAQRVMKLTLKDRHSVVERFKKEYRILEKLRTHPHQHVVMVIDGNILPGEQIPYLVSEFVEGEELQCFIEQGALSLTESLEFAKQVAEGLVHIHSNGVYHCDIKPGNLLWTPAGAKIIDFNVAVMTSDPSHGGGSRKYLPPDLDLSAPSSDDAKADRDCFALALTLYQAITGNQYPWKGEVPLPSPPRDPRQYPDCDDLAQELVDVLNHALASERAQRYPSAQALLAALQAVKNLRSEAAQKKRTKGEPRTPTGTTTAPERSGVSGNDYVDYLVTLYSQSRRSNRGTRGMDALGLDAYVETALDTQLLPAVLDGEFSLVVITGNAGDGKTAFLENLEKRAAKKGSPPERYANGFRFALNGREFTANLDGSQDEGDTSNDAVLEAFFAPFEGNDTAAWSASNATRLIAINEGRLVDFLQQHEERFPALKLVIQSGLQNCRPQCGVQVVNLNERSVVAPGTDGKLSIVEALVQRMTAERFWQGCESCDLKDKCYALHNARTFQDPKVGPMISRRLYNLYFLTHLRGRMHITLRDLRSALAYMLTSNRRCDEIRRLYTDGDTQAIADSYYFNSWYGGARPTADRLLSLLGELDMGATSGPHIDRALDFNAPDADRLLVQPSRRSAYADAILQKLYGALPRGTGAMTPQERMATHQAYVAMCRRRSYFERRDDSWRELLPYRASDRFATLLLCTDGRQEVIAQTLTTVLDAINRGEGLSESEAIRDAVALQVRKVDGGTIRSYRVFPRERFSLQVADSSVSSRFIEHLPNALSLTCSAGSQKPAELLIHLDLFEMFAHLNAGYLPTIEEAQGCYLSLSVFKNLLAAAPYQELLLTRGGRDIYRIARETTGRLIMHDAAQDPSEGGA